MQTLCDEHRAPVCKSCKGHRGGRHCCSRHHEGHPRVLGGGGGDSVSRFKRGGGASATGHYALRRAGARTGTLVRGRRRRSGKAGGNNAAAQGHARQQRGHGTASEEGTYPEAEVLPPRRDIPGGRGRDRAGHRQALTCYPLTLPSQERPGHK